MISEYDRKIGIEMIAKRTRSKAAVDIWKSRREDCGQGVENKETVFHPLSTIFATSSTFPHIHSFGCEFYEKYKSEKLKNNEETKIWKNRQNIIF